MQASRIRKSHQPGFSFLGSTSDASIFDTIQHDNPVSYRRVVDALDGRTDHIVPVSVLPCVALLLLIVSVRSRRPSSLLCRSLPS